MAASIPLRRTSPEQMSPTSVIVRRTAASDAALLKRVGGLARLLDEAFTVPLVGWKVGLDGLVGLIPGVGDVVTLCMSLEIVRQAVKAGAPRGLVLRLLGNVALDFAVGALPVVGDTVDLIFKANTRNVALIKQWLNDG